MVTYFGDRPDDGPEVGAGTKSNPRDLGNSPDEDNYFWFSTGATGANQQNMVGANFNPHEHLETDIMYIEEANSTTDSKGHWNHLDKRNVFTRDRFIKVHPDGNETYRFAEFVKVDVKVTYSDGATDTVVMQAMRLEGKTGNESLDGQWLIRPEVRKEGAGKLYSHPVTGKKVYFKDITGFEITRVRDGTKGTKDTTTDSIKTNAFNTALPRYCYTAGTMIKTARGPVPVEEIVANDKIYAFEDGWLPINWFGHSTAKAKGSGRGVCVPKGLFGLKHDTIVSLQHGMLLEESGREFFVPAKWLADEDWGGCRFVDDGRKSNIITSFCLSTP